MQSVNLERLSNSSNFSMQDRASHGSKLVRRQCGHGWSAANNPGQHRQAGGAAHPHPGGQERGARAQDGQAHPGPAGGVQERLWRPR